MSAGAAAAGDGQRGANARPPGCPVCRGPQTGLLENIGIQTYWRCAGCEARFLDPSQRPARADEHAFYRTHENDPDDPGYRRFLAKLATPLLDRLPARSRGLDYGCGPGPALAAMLREAGHAVALYDPLFFPDRSALGERYDFIACSETVEHFHDPAGQFDRLGAMLSPGGWLGVTTCFQTDDARFADWHYRRDPTHVVFYRAATFATIARQRGWYCEIPQKDVVLLRMAGRRRLPRYAVASVSGETRD